MPRLLAFASIAIFGAMFLVGAARLATVWSSTIVGVWSALPWVSLVSVVVVGCSAALSAFLRGSRLLELTSTGFYFASGLVPAATYVLSLAGTGVHTRDFPSSAYAVLFIASAFIYYLGYVRLEEDHNPAVTVGPFSNV